MGELSKSQVDKLGERLKKGPLMDEDLRLLDEFRHSFGAAYQTVLGYLRTKPLPSRGRPEKSTQSIVAKLRREKMRLSRMQDIAGCRVIVPNRFMQNYWVKSISADFSLGMVKDRRERPSFGYRAVHLIVPIDGKAVEIQVRTELQQLWAELSEKAFDVVHPEIKYGGGPSEFRNMLLAWSEIIASYEIWELARLREASGGSETTLPMEVFHTAALGVQDGNLSKHRELIKIGLIAIIESLGGMDGLKESRA